MKRLLSAGLAVATLTGAALPAFAADLPQAVEPVPSYDPVPAPSGRFDWTGAYVGGNIGWVWGQFDNTFNATGFDRDTDGVTGGFHAGYNYAITPNIVTGLEADFQWSDQYTRGTVNGVSTSVNSGWNSSFRGRVGYAFDRFMVYGTGGLAIANVEANAGGFTDSATALGWTTGAGLEGAVSDNITARVEYLYQDFGRESFTLGGNTVRSDLDNSTVRFGVSYKF